MNNSTSDSSSLNYGRQRIVLDYDEVTSQNILEVLEKALKIHNQNQSDCDYLIKYFLGKQDILNRDETELSSINNQVVVNNAFPITREIVGYTLGNPIELSPVNKDARSDVDILNKMYNYEESYMVDTNAAIYASVCGLSYYITLPSTEITKDNTPEIPIMQDTLDPRYTFVVQSSSIMNPQIMSCHYYKKADGQTIYTCYTDTQKLIVTDMQSVEVQSNPIGLDPITMEENSLFLTGDWEQAISVMNAENLVASDSLNDIEGTVRSLLVLIGAEVEDDGTTLSQIKSNRLLQLINPSGANVDAKFISPSLDSIGVQNVREYLRDVRNIITGIPDRQTNGTGGDTGTAVINRNGWTDIEIVAKLKELAIKKAKKRQLAIAITILKKLNLISESLLVSDVDINIDRHSMENLSARTTAFSTLVATNELATIDCLEITGLSNRPTEVVERGKEQRAERGIDATNSENGSTEPTNGEQTINNE